jgi:hypothetical protein
MAQKEGAPPEIEPATVPVWPHVGKVLGLGRNATYDAVARGEIPVIRFGRRIVVSKKVLARILDPQVA